MPRLVGAHACEQTLGCLQHVLGDPVGEFASADPETELRDDHWLQVSSHPLGNVIESPLSPVVEPFDRPRVSRTRLRVKVQKSIGHVSHIHLLAPDTCPEIEVGQ